MYTYGWFPCGMAETYTTMSNYSPIKNKLKWKKADIYNDKNGNTQIPQNIRISNYLYIKLTIYYKK